MPQADAHELRPLQTLSEGRYRVVKVGKARGRGIRMRATTTRMPTHHQRTHIAQELNRGGTAVVYEAEDLHTRHPSTNQPTPVALKVMNTREGVMQMPVKAVKREIELASQMRDAVAAAAAGRNPNITAAAAMEMQLGQRHIVQLLDVFAHEGRSLVIVWELVRGVDLLDLLNECGGRMKEEMAARYVRQLLRGVTYMHANGLCHRDLKPENCMVDRATDRLKIIDFGLSKHLDSAVTLGVGTPDYMAPELLSGPAGMANPNGRYDAVAVDVWAIGVMLYLCVTGVYPFEDPAHPDDVSRTLHNIRSGRARALPADVSVECRDVIASMLRRRPERRITLAQLAQHPWVTRHETPSTPTTPLTGSGHHHHRHVFAANTAPATPPAPSPASAHAHSSTSAASTPAPSSSERHASFPFKAHAERAKNFFQKMRR